MEQLRPDDHFLVLLEGDATPMHIGSLLVLDVPAELASGAAERVRDLLVERLVGTPLLRVLRRAPLGFDSDVWVQAEAIDIDHHFVIHRRADGSPWSHAELESFVADHVMRRLDLTQPPFVVHLLDPVEDGRLALFVKVHHCVSDGVGFQTILGLLSDHPPTDIQIPVLGHEADLPTRHDWLRASAARFREARREKPAIDATRRAALDTLRNPELQRPATPECVLSGPTSAQRSYATVTLPFARLKRCAKQLDATVNDLFLALAGTAVRDLLVEMQSLPEQPIVTNSARSYRRPDHGAFGNRIVAIHPHVATNVADPLERLQAIQASMGLERRRTEFDEALLNAPEVPFGAATRRRRFAGRRSTGGSVLPGNITVSNVPGPTDDRFFAGLHQRSNHPAPLLGSGRAINFTARRNADAFDVGVMVDPTKVADVHHVAHLFRAAFDTYQQLAAAAR